MSSIASKFRTDYRTPVPLLVPVVAWMNRVGAFLNAIRGLNGIDVVPNSAGGVDLMLPATESFGGGFSGYVYVGGYLNDLTAATRKAWVKVDKTAANLTTAATYDDGPPPDPFPQGQEWYNVSRTSGDIHVPLFL